MTAREPAAGGAMGDTGAAGRVFDNSNIWEVWFPEPALADVLAGVDVVPDIGQVRGVWKAALEKEVKAGHLVKWKGYWFPTPGAQSGIGPLKTCYGTPAVRDALIGRSAAP